MPKSGRRLIAPNRRNTTFLGVTALMLCIRAQLYRLPEGDGL
jgi:hypothetical protein